MKVLVIGSGGREHALAWKLAESPRVKKLYCAPGNAGIGSIAQRVPIRPHEIEKLADFAAKESIDLTVVGPEQALVLGVVDRFEKAGLQIFGPGRSAAQIEGSKSFAKNVMKKYKIPTAEYAIFTNIREAKGYIAKVKVPVVVKASGLAAGKGVRVCTTVEEALQALEQIMCDRIYGEAGMQVVIEECLKGDEMTFLALSDGENVLPLASSQDHKRISDGDQGPNTGGMGAYSPAAVNDPGIETRVLEEIVRPAVRGLAAEGRTYRGVLYAGLMVSLSGVHVLEFNARFGDPEAQALLPRMRTDLVDLIEATMTGRLKETKVEWDDRFCVSVVMASKGYPASSESGRPIDGLEEAGAMEDVVVFHAGTEIKDGRVCTAGGRVLGVTALGDGARDAIDRAYRAVAKIHFEGAQHRTDIGRRAIGRET